MRSSDGPRRAGLLCFAALVAIYVLSPVVNYSDGRNAGPTAASIVTDHDLVIDEFADVPWFGEYQTTFVDGHAYDFYPWTRAVFAVPVAAVVAVAGWVGIGDGPGAVVRSGTWERLLLLVPGTLATAGAAALAGALAWRRTADERQRARVAVAVAGLTGLTTGYWSTASRGLWQHGPACLWLTLALLATWHVRHGRRVHWAAALVGGASMAAAMTRPAHAFAALALGGWLLVSHRRLLAPAAAGAAVVAGVVTAVNLATFGQLLMPYYSLANESGEANPSALEAIGGTFVSPSRGALVFMPVLLVLAAWGGARWRAEDRLDLWVAGSAAVIVAFQATSSNGVWWAGHSFGARFVIDVVPLLAFLAVPAVERLVAGGGSRWRVPIAALLLWSVFVQAQGATLRETNCWNTTPTDIDVDQDRLWDWGDSQALTGVRWVLAGHSPLATSCESDTT